MFPSGTLHDLEAALRRSDTQLVGPEKQRDEILPLVFQNYLLRIAAAALEVVIAQNQSNYTGSPC